MSFRLFNCIRLAVVHFLAAIPLVYGLLPLGVALLALANPYFLELAQVMVVACVAIVVGYNRPPLGDRFDSTVTRIRIDASLTCADRAGLRCGTCFEHQAFDAVSREALPLRIRPLVAMECSVMDSAYMVLRTGAEVFDEFVSLKQACRAVGGPFSLRWHNTELNAPGLRDLYRSALAH